MAYRGSQQNSPPFSVIPRKFRPAGNIVAWCHKAAHKVFLSGNETQGKEPFRIVLLGFYSFAKFLEVQQLNMDYSFLH
jgi:hypothetical protein